MALCVAPEVAANLRARGQFPDARLSPTRLSDGRYAVSELTLTDRRHARYRPLLKAGTVEADSGLTFTGSSRIEMQVDGKHTYLTAAEVAHAFSIPKPNTYRYEIRKDESGYSGDPANNNRRCELVGGEDGNRYGAGETLWMSFFYVVGPGNTMFDPGGTGHNMLTQWHSVDTDTSRSPIFNMALVDGNLRINTRSDAVAGSVTHYASPRPTDGVPHHVVVSGLLGASGHLNVWVDGTQILNVDTPIGYYNDDGGTRKLAYPHWGMYQNNADLPTIIFNGNIEWGTSSLAARITSPIAVNVPDDGWV